MGHVTVDVGKQLRYQLRKEFKRKKALAVKLPQLEAKGLQLELTRIVEKYAELKRELEVSR